MPAASHATSNPGKATLLLLALLSALLLTHAFGVLPTAVNEMVVRWSALAVFALGALVFGANGSAFWCALCTAMAVVLNPVYPLPLGEMLHGAKIMGGCIAAAAVIRNW
ncbi:MAG: hypothetical protein RL354_1481 [Planctomycetota bacterium]|jgi:hypothetical protein